MVDTPLSRPDFIQMMEDDVDDPWHDEMYNKFLSEHILKDEEFFTMTQREQDQMFEQLWHIWVEKMEKENLQKFIDDKKAVLEETYFGKCCGGGQIILTTISEYLVQHCADCGHDPRVVVLDLKPMRDGSIRDLCPDCKEKDECCFQHELESGTFDTPNGIEIPDSMLRMK